jgi:hypothetical protein
MDIDFSAITESEEALKGQFPGGGIGLKEIWSNGVVE